MSENYLFEEFYDNLDENEKDSKIVSYLRELTIRITVLEDFNKYLMQLIPMKYKKFNPNGNPFFSVDDIQPNQEDFEKAKERMASLFEKSKLKI